MRTEDEASAIAKAAAQSEAATQRAANLDHARTLRFTMVTALGKVAEAQEVLLDAVDAVMKDGTGIDLDGPFSDGAFVGERMHGLAQCGSDLMNWVASLEGRESLAKLMLEGPPGFESVLLLGSDGTHWKTTPNADELRGGFDDNLYSRATVERECGPLRPGELEPLNKPRRVMVAPDGHCWEMSLDMSELDGGVRANYEHAHGELMDLRLTPLRPDHPGSLWEVQELREGTPRVTMTVPAQMLNDFAELYGVVLRQRNGIAIADGVRLINPLTGSRFTLTAAGRLFDENAVQVTWPDHPGVTLHQFFPPGSPEPGQTVTTAVYALSRSFESHGDQRRAPFTRVVRDRRDHDGDLWRSGGVTITWRELNDRAVVASEAFPNPQGVDDARSS